MFLVHGGELSRQPASITLMVSPNKALTKSPEFIDAAKTFLEPLLPAFEAIFQEFESAEENPDAPITPRTHRHHMKKRLEAAFERVKIDTAPEKYLSALMLLLKEALRELPEIHTKTAEKVKNDFVEKFFHLPAYKSLDTLVNSAERVSSEECTIALSQMKYDEVDKKMQIAYSLLHHTETCTGELRAEYAMHAAKRISELLYQPYVRMLHRLFRVTKKSKKTDIAKLSYGAAFKELLSSEFLGKYPDLLDQDAVLIRNAEAHERWDYLPDSDEVEVSDKGTPPKRLLVTDLLHRSEEMLYIAGVMLPAYEQFRLFSKSQISDDNIEDLHDLADLLHSDSTVQEAAILRLKAKAQK